VVRTNSAFLLLPHRRFLHLLEVEQLEYQVEVAGDYPS